jgi:hypothetical protein
MFHPQLEQHIECFSASPDFDSAEQTIPERKNHQSEQVQNKSAVVAAAAAAAPPPPLRPDDRCRPSQKQVSCGCWFGALAVVPLLVLLIGKLCESMLRGNLGSLSTDCGLSHLASFVMGGAVATAVATTLRRRAMSGARPAATHTGDTNHHRLRINRLLGSIEAPPLDPHDYSTLQALGGGDAAILVDLVEAHVALLHAAQATLDTLRWATALRMGRVAAGPIMDRVERGRGGIHQAQRLPGSRLRTQLQHHLRYHSQCLEAICGDSETNLTCTRFLEDSLHSVQVVTLAGLRQECIQVGTALSGAVNRLWQSTALGTKAHPLEIHYMNVRLLIEQAKEAQAYLRSWTIADPNDAASIARTPNSALLELRATVCTLHDALLGLQVIKLSETQVSAEWAMCQRIFQKLWKEYECIKEDCSSASSEQVEKSECCSEDLAVDQNRNTRNTLSGQSEFVSQVENLIEKSCLPFDRNADDSSVMVFSGQGTHSADQYRGRSTVSRRVKTGDKAPDPHVAEQYLLDELRRHLENMPAKKELEVISEAEYQPAAVTDDQGDQGHHMFGLDNSTKENANDEFRMPLPSLLVDELSIALDERKQSPEEYSYITE